MFDIDIPGFIKLAERWIEQRGMGAVVGELIQNACDENSTQVKISLFPIPSKPFVKLTVEDDNPEGFKNLRDAYTMFAESSKSKDPTKAGRFNAGEKFVIALAHEAIISTTTGTVLFTRKNGRKLSKDKTLAGSTFYGVFRMTREQIAEVEKYIRSIIVPEKVKMFYNGTEILHRTPISVFEETLETEIADESGILRKTRRKTQVEVYKCVNETATLYELGLPVVETGDKYHVVVKQRVPLNIERSNVTPAYLRHIRTIVANKMADRLKEDDARSTWVQEALSDQNLEEHAASKILDITFGEKRVVRDPTDPESASKAFSQGYTIIESRDLTKDQRANLNKYNLAPTSSQLFPTPKLKSSINGEKPIRDLTERMIAIVDYSRALANELLGFNINVNFYKKLGAFAATYSKEMRQLNLAENTTKYNIDELEELLIHEFAHDFEEDHFSHKFHDACCKLGVRLKRLAMDNPGFFDNHYRKLVPKAVPND